MQNLLGQQDLWSAYTRYQQDETIPANFLVDNVVEMTLIFEVDYQKKIGNSGSNKSDKDATQRASVLVLSLIHICFQEPNTRGQAFIFKGSHIKASGKRLAFG